MGPHEAVIAALVQLGLALPFNPHMTAINLVIEATMQAKLDFAHYISV